MEAMNNQHRITVSEMAPHVHSFSAGENKVKKITEWLKNWITLSLECGKVKPYDFLPSKGDLACHIGVSQGTMQNAFRILEDEGFVESKQRIGTYIKSQFKEDSIEKLTSKRELAIEIIKKYIAENEYKIGDKIIASRKLAQYIGISNSTIRLALNHLASIGILSQKDKNFYLANNNYGIKNVEVKTLVEKVAELIKEYINSNLEEGKSIPTNIELAKMFNVSIKTVHSAVKQLAKEGILYSRRGKYGTVVIGKENKIGQYDYERIETKIRHYIMKNSNVGDKLPSILEFSKLYEVSPKTIKKALNNLAEDGYLTFTRGRWGGTFVLDIPEESEEAYRWLAISPNYIPNMEN